MPRNIILDRNPSIVRWLQHKGIEGETVSSVTFNTAINNHIYGPCPLALAALAASVTLVRMPRIDPESHRRYRLGLLTPEELDHLGAHLCTYSIKQTGGPGL